MGSLLGSKMISRFLIVPLLVLATASCATREGGGSACGIEPHNVHKSTGSSTQMLGKATYGCKGNATKIIASVQIQVKSGGSWFTANSWRSVTKTNPGNNTEYTTQTWSMDCARGTYRTKATIQSWDSSGNPMTVQNTDYAYSESKTDPCG